MVLDRSGVVAKLPGLMACGMVILALVGAVAGRLTGPAAEAPVSKAVATRDLRFEDRADGAVLIYDARSTTPFQVVEGQNGFLRGTLRGLARTRRSEGLDSSTAFHLAAWSDGRLTLDDPGDRPPRGTRSVRQQQRRRVRPLPAEPRRDQPGSRVMWPFAPHTVAIHCDIDIEKTPDSLHAHAVPDGIAIRPGDVVVVHGAPTGIAFGERLTCQCPATVTRAGPLERLWTGLTAMFQLTELYDVGFLPKETP